MALSKAVLAKREATRQARRAARSIVARRMEEIRTARNISPSELAKRLGTKRMRVWRLENGFTEISVKTAEKIAEALAVTVASLYRESKAA